MLNCIDNSGAIIVECLANLRMKRHGKVGEEYLQEDVESPATDPPKVIVL